MVKFLFLRVGCLCISLAPCNIIYNFYWVVIFYSSIKIAIASTGQFLPVTITYNENWVVVLLCEL